MNYLKRFKRWLFRETKVTHTVYDKEVLEAFKKHSTLDKLLHINNKRL